MGPKRMLLLSDIDSFEIESELNIFDDISEYVNNVRQPFVFRNPDVISTVPPSYHPFLSQAAYRSYHKHLNTDLHLIELRSSIQYHEDVAASAVSESPKKKAKKSKSTLMDFYGKEPEYRPQYMNFDRILDKLVTVDLIQSRYEEQVDHFIELFQVLKDNSNSNSNSNVVLGGSSPFPPLTDIAQILKIKWNYVQTHRGIFAKSDVKDAIEPGCLLQLNF